MDLMSLTAVELGKRIRAGEVSVREAAEAALPADKLIAEALAGIRRRTI